MSDILRLDHINSLPQPFIATMLGGSCYDVELICVETGLMTINVSGMPQNTDIGEVISFTDQNGTVHPMETFFSDYEEPKKEKK